MPKKGKSGTHYWGQEGSIQLGAGWEVWVVRGLGLGLTNPVGIGEVWDMCLCCGGVGGVGDLGHCLGVWGGVMSV